MKLLESNVCNRNTEQSDLNTVQNSEDGRCTVLDNPLFNHSAQYMYYDE